MACLKEVNRSASVAFAPDAPYFAAGTIAGAVDSSFSSSANLDIFKLDFRSDDRELQLVGMVPSSEPFNRLSWGKKVSSESNDFPLGLIAGGLVDGNIGIWNPTCLISSESNENAFVQQLSRHKGPVRGLEFNPHTPQNLASGADEGEILIWDLSKPNAPTHFPPLRGTGTASQLEISFVSWNMKVAPILASTSLNGTTVVWDLRRQKPVISFSDSVRRRCSVLQWSPEFATQLVVASDEDSSPVLRIWDMRNTMSPVKELLGHTKGVVAMSWCPNDSAYLLTCAKDNRTICWDTNSGEIVSELPAGTNWNFDVHWYPKIPGVISASSFDGKIGIYNVEACSRFGIGEGEFVAAPLRAPKWYKRRSGVSFGFGGKLLTYKSTDGTNATTGYSEVRVHTVVTEQSLVSSSSELESAMQSGDKSSLRLLCDKKTQESESEEEKETWGFLKVMFEEDGTARTKLLSHLGFTLPVEEKDAISDTISQDLNSSTLENKEEDESSEQKETNMFSSDNGEDFFNNLPSPKADTPVSNSVHNFSSAENSGQNAEELQLETDGQDETSSDPSFDEAVQRALVVGDYKGAVAQCIFADRMADALVIAHAGSASLWESTRDQYLKMSRSPYLEVVSAMVNNDLMSLVNTRPLKSWKETLALLCSFAQQEEWNFLCDTLASRLMTAGNSLAASLCFICAGNIDKTVEIWSKNVTSEKGVSYLDLLQDLMEKTIVLALASGHKRFSSSFCKLVEKYAEILASQGLLTKAMEYLKLMGSEELTPELIILRDSIALATEPEEEMPAGEFKNSQPHKAVNPADQFCYLSQPYYVEPTPPLMQPNVSYGVESHPLSQPYGRIYNTPTPYQPAVQPNMFVPSQDPQTPQLNFTPPPVSTQPAVVPFTPSTPPVLKNVEQYQQPTLGSRLYPQVNPNSTYQGGPPRVPPQVGSTPGHKISQVVAPTPRGFMPVNVPTGVQRSGVNTMQPSSPTRAAPVQPAMAPAAPPPTVHTADTSNVSADQKAAIATLKKLYSETSEALGVQRANPAKKREIEDNSRKLGALFAKLNIGDISKDAGEKLVQLCQALDNGDFSTASQIQVRLSTHDWEECSFWLVPVKRMIKTRQSVR